MIRRCTERLLRLVVGSVLLACCSSKHPLGGSGHSFPSTFDVRGTQEVRPGVSRRSGLEAWMVSVCGALPHSHSHWYSSVRALRHCAHPLRSQILRDSGESSNLHIDENASANLPASWSSAAALGRARASRRNPESLLEEALLAAAPSSNASPEGTCNAGLAPDQPKVGAKHEGAAGKEGVVGGVEEGEQPAGEGSLCSPCAGQLSGTSRLPPQQTTPLEVTATCGGYAESAQPAIELTFD